MKPSRVRPLSHLKSRAAEMIRNIVESREPMLITLASGYVAVTLGRA